MSSSLRPGREGATGNRDPRERDPPYVIASARTPRSTAAPWRARPRHGRSPARARAARRSAPPPHPPLVSRPAGAVLMQYTRRTLANDALKQLPYPQRSRFSEM
ncbi:hypothetical protein EVAR_35227_1 [Eumeta japonica]|uniref:Uncharacterized protein n=1 Tax=Eumeta variegata TaxID=151549 RepID=A0A4C1VDD2_EUMVA|nr:hypothetical protein EVAR_35227_1 [Eumeta japonica]